ncbi:uncharacterized protein PG986_012911 [Apiospora aurea]|uniref:Protein kinase domain-containing protein n=1 Tax=Apiospora aurea TaxID=335848 RepID=A0ABR1Q1B8_9PEZI
MPVKQTIASRYIDRRDLAALLARLFSSNFKVKLTRKMSELGSLKDRIDVLRCKNYQSRYFVPRQALLKKLSQDVVKRELRGTVPLHQLDEMAHTVFRRGRLIFAILVLIDRLHYMINFIEDDQLQQDQLDHKLPFGLQALQNIMMKPIDATRFHEKQWEITAPKFRSFVLRRHLAYDTILPFRSEVKIGQGGFGDVYRITIDSAHQRFDALIHQLVRKDLQSHVEDYETELQNLSILRLLEHPNISKLLGCYTYRGVHSFIFSEASGGSFLMALAGLASAVANVHKFVVDELPLAYIGCHHDLKPGNVLVENQRFILSDFGLAPLKPPDEGSTTPAKVRHGCSIAPECQSLDGTFEKHLVQRASDVWSLGCIMLDVATYMMHGPDAVTDFETKRVRSLITQGGAPEKLLLTLISRMLRLEPQQRPNSATVEASMIWIALFSLSQTILDRFTTLCEMHRLHEASVEPWVEKIRFESWMKSLDFPTSRSETLEIPTDLPLNFVQFEMLCRHLNTLSREIATVVAQTEVTNQRVLLPLRRLNTILYGQLPSHMREKAQRISEILLLESDSLGDLEKAHSGDTSGNLAKVSMLAGSKNISQTAEHHIPRSSYHMEIAAPTVDKTRLGHHWTGWVDDSDRQRRRVLIVFKGYDDVRLRAKLYTRMGEVAELCQSVQDCESVGLLQCRGFFHHDKREAFGLVYDFPMAPNGVTHEDTDPTTLYQYMRDKKVTKPLLKCRFQLAYRLAQSLSEVHKIGWVHKGLSSSSVILFSNSRTTTLPRTNSILSDFTIVDLMNQ